MTELPPQPLHYEHSMYLFVCGILCSDKAHPGHVRTERPIEMKVVIEKYCMNK